MNINRLKRNTILLRAYSANEILKKGYSLTYKEGEVQKNCFSLQKQDLVTIRFYDGDVIAQIQEVNHANKEN